MMDRIAASRLAEHLSGRPCYVSFCDMPLYEGLCCRDRAGKVAIRINRNLDEKKAFRVLLHEIAHAAKHYDKLPMWSFEQQKAFYSRQPTSYKAESRTMLDEIRDAMERRREVEANMLARRWYVHAVTRSNTTAGRIAALMNVHRNWVNG